MEKAVLSLLKASPAGTAHWTGGEQWPVLRGRGSKGGTARWKWRKCGKMQGTGKEGQRTCGPLRDDDGEDAGPDGEQGHDKVHGRREGAHDVGPHPRAVHDAHEDGQLRAGPAGSAG